MSYLYEPLTRRRLLKGVAATWLLSVSRIGMAASTQMIAVRIWPSKTYTRITLESSAPLHYKQFMLSHPDRVVVDIEGVQLNNTLREMGGLVKNTDPYLRQVRAGQYNSHTLRLVFELKQAVKPQLFTLKPVAEFRNRLVLDLFPRYPSKQQQQDDPLLALLEEYNQGENLSDGLALTEKSRQKSADKPLLIMLDPGHGGEDPGAIGIRGTREKDIVLRIAHQLAELIGKETNIKVHMTRREDIFIPLGVRVAKARKLGADMFISIHADAFTNRTARGSSVYALSTKGASSAAARYLAHTQNESDEIGGVTHTGDRYLDHTMFDLVQTATIKDSLQFGDCILKCLAKVNRLHQKEVDQAGFAVLKAPDIPSILVETAFISNPEEERKLKTSTFQREIARSLLVGITQFARTLRN